MEMMTIIKGLRMDVSKETETLKTQTEQKMNLKYPIIQLEDSEEAVKAE